MSLLEFKVPHGQLRPPPSLQNDSTLLPCPHLDAWSDTRGATATRQQQGEARCAGLFASAAREDRSELCKGSSDSAFITAQSNKAVARAMRHLLPLITGAAALTKGYQRQRVVRSAATRLPQEPAELDDWLKPYAGADEFRAERQQQLAETASI